MDWEYWLGRKYDLLGQNAAADTTRANAGMISAQAGANLDTVRAGLLPSQTRSDIALQRAQANLAAATAAQQNEETKYIGRKALADIFNTTAQGGLYNEEAGARKRMGYGFPISGSSLSPSMGSSGSLWDSIRTRNPLADFYQ